MKNRSLKTITRLLAAAVLATCFGSQLLADDFEKAIECRDRIKRIEREIKFKDGRK